MVGRIGCHLVVRVQTRFAPRNTISYACKHVLRLVIRFRMRANTFCALQHDFVRMQTRFTSLQHDFVRMQTRFTSCNTISYACKHVLRLVIRFRTHANTFYIVATTHSMVRMTVTSLQQLIRRSKWPLHCCSKRFGGRNDRYIAAANDLGVNMTVTSLQQTIRGSKWPLHRCSKRFGGQNGLLHHCNTA